jgi:hypothetical protein
MPLWRSTHPDDYEAGEQLGDGYALDETIDRELKSQGLAIRPDTPQLPSSWIGEKG